MRIILLTQDDPFYLAETTNDFIQKIKAQKDHNIITTIVTSASPFGKKENVIKKILKTYKIFGFSFFLHYSIRFFVRRFVLRISVSKVIKQNNIPLWNMNTSINSKESVDKIKELNPDVIVIIAGNQIIKKQILDIPKYGVINAHSSLLPEYKGLMPTFWVLKNNEEVSGVTVYKLTEGIDDGPIIIQDKIKIDPSTTQSNLVKKCKYLANDLLIKSFDLLDKEDQFLKNDNGSYYKFPQKEDVRDFYKLKKRFF